MKKSEMVTLLTLLVLGSLSLHAQEGNLTGRGIMKMVETRPEAPGERSRLSMILTDNRGRTREREMVMTSLKEGELEYSLMFFTAPADVAGTGFLSRENSSGETDQWLYLPALGRTRRIAGSSRDDSFMGSDFSFEDLEPRDSDDDGHRLLREENLNGRACWVVESIPLKDSSYSRRISWVDRESLIPLQVDFYTSGISPSKRLTVADLRRVGPFWYPFRMTMSDLENSRNTSLVWEEIQPDDSLEAAGFTVGVMERGLR